MFFDAESKNRIHFTPSDQLLAAEAAENGRKWPFFRFRCTLQPKIDQISQNECDFRIQRRKTSPKMIWVYIM